MNKTKSGWWKNSKHKGIRYLAFLFDLDRVELIGLEVRKRKATKSGHNHETRPSGSKMLKKYNRPAWDLKYKEAK